MTDQQRFEGGLTGVPNFKLRNVCFKKSTPNQMNRGDLDPPSGTFAQPHVPHTFPQLIFISLPLSQTSQLPPTHRLLRPISPPLTPLPITSTTADFTIRNVECNPPVATLNFTSFLPLNLERQSCLKSP